MLHAIKPMIWQALQTLKEPRETADVVKRSKLQVLSHNLSADGNLPQLLKPFDGYFKEGEEKIDCKEYLETFIHDAVESLKDGNKEKEMKICVERVHKVCWELCKVQVTAANGGLFPSLLTEESTKTWWKIFNTFAECDKDTGKTLYPVVMDWEEVDYWVNVALKVMALPTISPQRQERQVMGSMLLTFQDALLRFNSRLNENNGMYVHDAAGKPDVVYIQQALAELNTRLFEGIYLSGTLTKIKKGHTSPKWCMLYQLGLGFADSPAEVDKADTKSYVPISMETQVEHKTDKSGRPIRLHVKNPKDAAPLLFEASNISTRNKWLTAMICMKHSKTPNYAEDSKTRHRNRHNNRQYEAETKLALQQQKQETQRQVEQLNTMMEEEKLRFEAEAEQLRSASREELQQRIADYETKLQTLMQQLQLLSQSHEQEKQTIVQQHEMEQDRLRRQLGNEMGMVQDELEAEIRTKAREFDELQQRHRQLEDEQRNLKDSQQKDKEQWEERVRQLEAKLAELTKQKEQSESGSAEAKAQLEERLQQLSSSSGAELQEKERRLAAAEEEAARLAQQLLEAQRLGQEQLEQERAKLAEAQQQEQRQRVLAEETDTRLDEQMRANARLKEEALQLQARSRELEEAAGGSEQQLRELRQQLQQLQDERQQWEKDTVMLPELRRMLDEESATKAQLQQEYATIKEELKAKTIVLQERQKELTNTIAAKDSLQRRLEEAVSPHKFGGHHRGPGFDAAQRPSES